MINIQKNNKKTKFFSKIKNRLFSILFPKNGTFKIFNSMAKIRKVSLSLLLILLVGTLNAQRVFLGDVENKVISGRMAQNRNLGFGCKNVFLEVLEDKNYDIVGKQSDADLVFKAEVLYFDVNKTKRNVSVFHSDVEETLVIIKGYLYNKDGKKVKDAVAEESSSEFSTSTLITDEGSTEINQQALSQAIKKTCVALINKIFTK
mgnify:CR=1 FL=1